MVITFHKYKLVLASKSMWMGRGYFTTTISKSSWHHHWSFFTSVNKDGHYSDCCTWRNTLYEEPPHKHKSYSKKVKVNEPLILRSSRVVCSAKIFCFRVYTKKYNNAFFRHMGVRIRIQSVKHVWMWQVSEHLANWNGGVFLLDLFVHWCSKCYDMWWYHICEHRWKRSCAVNMYALALKSLLPWRYTYFTRIRRCINVDTHWFCLG